MQDLGTLGGSGSVALAINRGGDVVGSAYTDDDATLHAFVYHRGRMRDLGTLGGYVSEAQDINDADQIVGYSYLADGSTYRAFMYEHGQMFDLGTLGGPNSIARAINNRGEVVGTADTPVGSYPTYRAFAYRQGVMTDLNELIDPMSGWTLLEASDINDCGQIVGYGLIDGYGHGFLLTPVGQTCCGSED
jgi:probable HAF family extracellular repeat protein